MKYVVRQNPRAYNPVTGKTDLQRAWEVAQVAWDGGSGHDSEEVVWHCAEVVVNGQPISEVIAIRTERLLPDEKEEIARKGIAFHGICTRDQNNAISIREGRNDVS